MNDEEEFIYDLKNKHIIAKEVATAFMDGIPYESKDNNIKIKRTTSYVQLLLNNNIIAERQSFSTYRFGIRTCKVLGAIEYLKELPEVNITYDREGCICLNGNKWDWENSYTIISNYTSSKDDKQELKMNDKELAIELINRLNNLIKDPEVLSLVEKLIETRFDVSESLFNHPTIQASQDGDKIQVGTLGLLNGMVGVIPDGPKKDWGYICGSFDENNKLLKFMLVEDPAVKI